MVRTLDEKCNGLVITESNMISSGFKGSFPSNRFSFFVATNSEDILKLLTMFKMDFIIAEVSLLPKDIISFLRTKKDKKVPIYSFSLNTKSDQNRIDEINLQYPRFSFYHGVDSIVDEVKKEYLQ